MECAHESGECPNGWSDCNYCDRLIDCLSGLYHGEPESPEPEPSDLDIVIKAAKISEKVMNDEVSRSVGHIKGTVVEKFSRLEGNDWWREFGKHRASDLHVKEPLPLQGGVVHSGGSKSKNHKKPLRKKPEYMKFLGM